MGGVRSARWARLSPLAACRRKRRDAGIADAKRAMPRPADVGRCAVARGNKAEGRRSKIEDYATFEFRLSFDLATSRRVHSLPRGACGAGGVFGMRCSSRLAGGFGSCDAFCVFILPTGRFNACSPSVKVAKVESRKSKGEDRSRA